MANVKCVHCGKYILQSVPTCPHCGAINVASVGGGAGYSGTSHEAGTTWRTSQPRTTVNGAVPGRPVMRTTGRNGKTQTGSKGTMNRSNSKWTGFIVLVAFYVIAALISAARNSGTDDYDVTSKTDTQKNDTASQGNGSIFDTVTDENARAFSYYYNEESNDLYYCSGLSADDGGLVTRWWIFDPADKEWYETDSTSGILTFPDEISAENLYYLSSDEGGYPAVNELTKDEVDIDYSRNYQDSAHTPPPDMTYYELDGEHYYYMFDPYSFLAGEEDRTGWYKFDQKEGWQFYCDADDHDTLGDELWYEPKKHMVCNRWSFDEAIAGKMGVTDFQDSQAAKDVEEARKKAFGN